MSATASPRVWASPVDQRPPEHQPAAMGMALAGARFHSVAHRFHAASIGVLCEVGKKMKPVAIHTRLQAARARRGQKGPDLTSVRRFLKGKT